MYLITFSEMIGTHGEKIARKVSETLGYAFSGEEELIQTASGMGLFSDLKEWDEKAPTFLERLFSERPKIYLNRLQSVIYELAKRGNTLFFGRGAQFLLQSFDCALHILVTGSMEKRIRRIMEEKQVGRETAEKILHRSDQNKKSFIKFAYDEDWLNPRLYDLNLNTDKLSIDSATQMIVEAARSEEIKSCGIDSIQLLGKLSLSRKIESALLEAGFDGLHLFEVEGPNSVRLFGVVNSDKEKREIENLIRRINGVKTIKNELVVFTGSMGGL